MWVLVLASNALDGRETAGEGEGEYTPKIEVADIPTARVLGEEFPFCSRPLISVRGCAET